MKQLRLTDFKATRQIIETTDMADHHGNDSEAESVGFFDVPSDDEEGNFELKKMMMMRQPWIRNKKSGLPYLVLFKII